MSDAARQNLKVSREGIVLIKSFEGFRPRAIQRAEGGWIIGYGHTRSAREGASVSEADAELLLRYDLLPVEKSVNETVPDALNQHQFDALVSFAFSVGIDRFVASDVCQRLNAGAPGEAADAIMGWPEPALPESALRRRAAERALFVANPSTPVALSDLLLAPLPPPAVIVPLDEPQVEPPVEPPVDVEEADTVPADVDVPAPIDPRGAAVAALLGEPTERLVQTDLLPEPVVPIFFTAESPAAAANEPPEPSNDNPPAHVLPQMDEAASSGPADELSDDTHAVPETAAEAPAGSGTDAAAESTPSLAPVVDAVVLNATRYAPYSSVMVGPLPFLPAATRREEPAAPEAPAIDDAVVEATPEVIEAAPVVIDMAPVLIDAAAVDTAPVIELVLTPPEDSPEPAVERSLWAPEQRETPDASENNLFGEDLTLTLGGGPIMRHEVEMEVPARFDWRETGPFIFMGGVGLVSFGASMAAFRRAAEQSGGNELTAIGWVLALIGLACVGVSSINLYRRFGLPGGD